MAAISKIEVKIKTGDVANAGTDGDVYLGICGREFYLDRDNVNDFEKGHTDTFILGGSTANIANKGENDPRKPQLDTENLPSNVGVDGFPVYIRFEPRGGNPDWNLETVSVRVFVGNDEFDKFVRNFGHDGLWLGQKSGKFCYIGSGLDTI